MQLTIGQPDSRTNLAWVDIDLSKYNFRNRSAHAGVSIHSIEEWGFYFDKILKRNGIVRLLPWKIEGRRYGIASFHTLVILES